MHRYTLHVPLQLNDGSPADPEILEEIESDLLAIGGGFTATDGIGAWRGDGTVYREPVRLYAIDSDDPDAHPMLTSLASAVARWLDQEAVYLTTAELTTQLLTARVPA